MTMKRMSMILAGLVLCFVLALGMMPGMSLTAFADDPPYLAFLT